MIIIPWGRDQPGNARRAEQLGVAIVIPKEKFNGKILAAAANRIEAIPTYRQQAKKHATRLQESQTFENGYRKLRSYIRSFSGR